MDFGEKNHFACGNIGQGTPKDLGRREREKMGEKYAVHVYEKPRRKIFLAWKDWLPTFSNKKTPGYSFKVIDHWSFCGPTQAWPASVYFINHKLMESNRQSSIWSLRLFSYDQCQYWRARKEKRGHDREARKKGPSYLGDIELQKAASKAGLGTR